MKTRALSHFLLLRICSISLILSCVPTAYAKNSDPGSEAQIIISSATKAGSFYSDDFTISGRIRGSGIKDAAVYVGGERLSTLPIHFHHQNSINSRFKITIDASEEPELRVVTNAGTVITEKIDVLDLRE